MTNLAIMRAATSAPCLSSCVLHCLLVCLAYRRIKKNLFETCLCQTPVGRGHRKSEPRSVGVLANTHGMTLLLQRTETPEPQLHLCFADGSSVAVFRSPSGTLCPKARGLSPCAQARLASIFRSALQNSLLRWGGVNGEWIYPTGESNNGYRYFHEYMQTHNFAVALYKGNVCV